MKLKETLLLLVILTALSCRRNLDHARFSGWDNAHMKEVKKSLKKPGSPYYQAFEKLVSAAEAEMQKGPYSVTFKNVVPPGGTKNDYMSMGPYWWPDPDKPDGLPYIRRDGVVNPESQIDRLQFEGISTGTRTLALAWYFTGNRKYAEKAAQLLNVWFVDPKTRMNPHLEFAQGIPGRTTGRGIGIIDFRGMFELTDAISLLSISGVLKNEQHDTINEWFHQFFEWLTTSKHGHDEDNYFNNHAVAYDVIATSIARYLGNDQYVAEKIGAVPGRRIDPMIRADGRQPEELIRTKAFGYSVGNLRNFFDAGETGLKVGVNIFPYTNPEGGSLKKALEFLMGYIGQPEKWEWEQISDWEPTENSLGLLIRRAARYFNDPEYLIVWEQTFAERTKSHWTLLVHKN